MKPLQEILDQVEFQCAFGNLNVAINEIQFDSRKVVEGDLYCAQKGVQVDGHDFIDAAIASGAIVILFESKEFKDFKEGIVYLYVKSASKALALMATNYFGQPSSKLKLIGITGTNGKTTIASQLFNLARKLGYNSGLLSTVKVCINSENYPATHTTPDSLQINYYMNQMVEQGVDYCFMEVSSHGIDQNRVEGLDFDGAVFTNLSHDHLDYHESFKGYRDVKKRLFDGLKTTAFALTNIDDKNGSYMLQNTRARKLTYGLKTLADFHSRIIENNIDGLYFRINKHEVYARMLGVFNAYNLTAIYGVGIQMGWSQQEVLVGLSSLQGADGRFQVSVSDSGIYTIVDYAHTPDALENVLETIGQFQGINRVITVMGCGGDRDRSKRPKMANISAKLSDYLILTSDNPRTEDPFKIIEDMEQGIKGEKDVISIIDRKQAIRLACQMAEEKDLVLVAGKGHETYQEIKGVKHHFDDRETIQQLLTELEK
ncbi:MAG: UDP-N-acetylmuramoyl-L-alanyl-D-glutamate--2,6-diaminopimelate ligase [Flavobacteriaceae bacterium]